MGRLLGWLVDKFKVADDSGIERAVFDKDGYIYPRIDAAALDGSTGKKVCLTNGVSVIEGGTGIADMTLAAPSKGDVAIIRMDSLTSGSVVVTCAMGVTVDGTNNTMTFDAAGEAIVLTCKSATEWQIVLNIGAVALSSV